MVRSHKVGRPERRRGAIALLTAVCLTMLMGVVALSVDGGLLLTDRRHAQATADAAAMAAATVLYANFPNYQGSGPATDARDAALAVAAANGYANDGTETTVTVNIPPAEGPYAGLDGYAEVVVQFNQVRHFSGVFGSGRVPVKARAVAQGQWASPKPGILLLDYSGQGSLSTQRNGAYTETTGTVVVNSNHTHALVSTGTAAIKASEIYVTGGVQVSDDSNLQTFPLPSQIFTGVHPTPDPLKYLPPPAVPDDGTMTMTDKTDGSGGKIYTLTPGRYTSLPAFTAVDDVILQQASANGAGGVYYLQCSFISNEANVNLDTATTGGVLIYNRGSVDYNERVQITGGASGTVNLAPLTSGPYTGLVLWQDRASNLEVKLDGNGSYTLRGTVYAAGAQLTVTGNGGTYVGDTGATQSGSLIGSQYITRDLSLSGDGNVIVNYRPAEVGRTKQLRLME